MVKMKTGTVVYMNRWPERLDLLELIYYPVIMIILPNVAKRLSADVWIL